MTTKAREVLEDCRVALSMLETEKDSARWRVLWAGAVALVRAVGHVLKTVDGKDRLISQILGEHYARWQNDDEHKIFPEFIKHERDNLLKQYDSDVHPMETVPVVVQMPAVSLATGETHLIQEIMHLEENIYRPMLEGSWEGDDCRDVLSEALDWWARQLDAIDSEVKKRRASVP